MSFLRVCLGASALWALGCAPRPAGAPAPTLPGAPVPPPAALPGHGPGIRLGPAALRYAIHTRRRVEQDAAGQPPTEMAYRVFVSTRVVGPPDTAGYAVTHTVDSIVPDSGTFVPPTLNLAAARGLRFTGRLAPSGEVRGITPSDSLQAKTLGQVLGNVRDFYPRVPSGGLRPGAAWTDTVTTAERGSGSEVVVRAVLQTATSEWQACSDGARCVRVQGQGPYTVLGTGEQGGQPFELVGDGTRRASALVSADGRYLGGEVSDSANLSITLPAQGVTIPLRQILYSTVTVVP